MATPRKIAVITGSRAEYGLLYWLMKEIQSDPSLELQVVVTGMHLSSAFGNTYKAIENDGFKINSKVDLELGDDSVVGVTNSLGLGVIGFAKALNELKPDIAVVLGDRYELLAAAQAALIAKIPLAHIHGGEKTEGAFDEAIRHSITKMSHLHFVAHEDYRRRVIQLGENPDRVFNFGTIGLDHLRKTPLLNRGELEASLDFKLGNLNFLVTYHPVTLSKDKPSTALEGIFGALDQFQKAKVVFTKSNSDTDGKIIGERIDQYVSKNQGRAQAFTSLGNQRYLSLINAVDVVIGNSSSGIIEVPAFKKPTVNIGLRQRGRLRAKSVIDCTDEKNSIVMAIEKALSPEFLKSFEKTEPPYKSMETSLKIKEVLKSAQLDGIIMKSFYDMDFK